MSNTALWDAVFKTDPSQTKHFKRAGGFEGTSIKPLYLVQKATEQWGPMGEAWGVESVEHIISGDSVFIKARLWYPGKIGRAFVEHWGGDVLVKGDRNRPNDEAFKMAFTDATGKCLVQLGFSADVHFGLFDDKEYVNERTQEEKQISSAAKGRKLDAFKLSLLNAVNPLVVWNENQDVVKEQLSLDEPEATLRGLLVTAADAIERLLDNSEDPNETFREQLPLIKLIAEKGVPADYGRIKDAGANRKAHLQSVSTQMQEFKEKRIQ